jgi:predicted ABC-type ATPase
MVVVAGPSGSGKTTCFPVTALGVDSFNLDDRCAQSVGSYWAIPGAVKAAVARECEQFIADRIERGRSFAVETTLRGTAPLEQAATARRRGFATHLIFVAPATVAANVERVLQRAQGGGHATTEADIRAIREAGLVNLARAVGVFERVRVFDSSARWTPPRPVASFRDARMTTHGILPDWLERVFARLPGDDR